jgi:hypothetical protein
MRGSLPADGADNTVQDAVQQTSLLFKRLQSSAVLIAA